MKAEDSATVLTIKTVYHIRGKEPKVVRSKNANRAVMQCVGHMQINHYGAHIAEVYDTNTGELHGSVKLKANGDLLVHIARNARDYETRYAVSFLIVE